jgi:hypothetical protein
MTSRETTGTLRLAFEFERGEQPLPTQEISRLNLWAAVASTTARVGRLRYLAP